MYLSGVSSSVVFFFLFALLLCFSAGLCSQLSLSLGRGLGGSIFPRPWLHPLSGNTPPSPPLCLPARVGPPYHFLRPGAFLGRINELLGPATGALRSELRSEDPKGGRGAGVPWAGGCGSREKRQHRAHNRAPTP